jgi:hypothetical protein
VCRSGTVALSPRPVSAGLARQFLAETCRRWELEELKDDLLLAVSELVTNSIVHARTPVLVTVAVAADAVEVGVRDHDSQLPVVRAERPDLISDLDTLSERLPSFEDDDPRHPKLWVGEAKAVTAGRGLHLLSAVSDEWGVATFAEPNPGKEVWFRHALPQHWPYAADCECRPGAGRTTASGRPLHVRSGPWDSVNPGSGDLGIASGPQEG